MEALQPSSLEGNNSDAATPIKRKKLNLYRLPPKNFENKEDVIWFENLSKQYELTGGAPPVRALHPGSLSPGDAVSLYDATFRRRAPGRE